MWFALYLLDKGAINNEQLIEAVREQQSRRTMFGKIAIKQGMLTVKQASAVFAAQADNGGKPFGEVAVELGFLTAEQLNWVLVEQMKSIPGLGAILVEKGVLSQNQVDDEVKLARRDAAS